MLEDFFVGVKNGSKKSSFEKGWDKNGYNTQEIKDKCGGFGFNN